ncbi:WW domain-binding protein 4 [Zootermopsis nevadensis]|uniref:WW domain-binding protein 4 n=1 Tax=Zootermopsis nevadensis TaxID=136037 RepID=A0A067R836_ZOONE|nr:WW domain-binding protein 4 [Zootermopsis nevadensis]
MHILILVRADYWKSQAKKFCEYCKCWIADNIPSVEFHENGKRHKENVKRRLSEIGKKSRQEHQKSIKVDAQIKKMEEAALKAYMKDVEENADFSSQLIKEKLSQQQRQQDADGMGASPAGSAVAETTKVWYEAQSDEGHVYYWHIETGESRWEPPEEEYLSLTEQKKVEGKALKNKKEKKRKEKAEDARMKEEERARLERERMRSRRVKEEDTKTAETPMPVLGPAPRVDPYGSWKPVEIREPMPVDLQLPEQEYVQIKVPAIMEPKVEFREKTFSCLGDDDRAVETGFKRRKFNCNPKRSMRQRLDQDE